MKKPALYLGILAAVAGGFGAGEFYARTMLVVEANRLVEITQLAERASMESRAANTRFRVEQALWTAELLRRGNTADALRLSEDVIERARAELERAKASQMQSGDVASFDALLDRIAEYQTQYPRAPRESPN